LLRPPKVNVLGIGVHALDLSQASDLIISAARQKQKGYVCVTGVHGVMEARRDPAFRNILHDAFLVTPDGMPTVWLGRRQGHARMGRVYGPDLMREVCARSTTSGLRHFLYGGNPGVADALAANLQRWYPQIVVAGTFTPPFRPLEPSELATLKHKMEAAKPDIVWIGLSTPKQEKFMAAHIGVLPCEVMVGVGAAFDIHTGRVNDAPAWIKKAGMQWAHRLYQEPERLWKRYLKNNCAFVAELTKQLIGIRRYPLPRQQ
jgi:N-acetylglucosaminyldiphosphoundecaprenol N-acetyl-beta-D-mannosaminyltransferase